jgi:hypothetical protein
MILPLPTFHKTLHRLVSLKAELFTAPTLVEPETL